MSVVVDKRRSDAGGTGIDEARDGYKQNERGLGIGSGNRERWPREASRTREQGSALGRSLAAPGSQMLGGMVEYPH